MGIPARIVTPIHFILVSAAEDQDILLWMALCNEKPRCTSVRIDKK